MLDTYHEGRDWRAPRADGPREANPRAELGARYPVTLTPPVRRSYIAPTTLTWPRFTAGATMG